MTCTIHSYDLTGLCFTCGHINESIRAHQQAADAWHGGFVYFLHAIEVVIKR